MADSVIQLKCDCNNYPWGKQGHHSLAARYASKTPRDDFQIDEDKNYAEMWMGTYPTTPAHVLSSNEELQAVLNANKEKLIGKPVLDKFGADLPFLPKILSIQKALPLQIHPDKELASKLHKEDPEKFSDPNHKPEIAVALTTFETFVGWKPLADIEEIFQLKPLQKFLPKESTPFNNEVLKAICKSILSAPEDVIASTQDELLKIPKEQFGKQAYIQELLPRLQKQYSKEDPGNLVALLLMNFRTLSPGQSIYVPADGIHAYLSGDIVECMARSDNVMNTGFCPPTDRDSVDTFVRALTFQPHDIDEALLPSKPSSKSLDGKTKEYAPPMSEFDMLVTQLKADEVETVKPVKGPSIMIVTSGSGTMTVEGKSHKLDEGYVFFIGQGVEVVFETQKGLEVYRAYAEA